MYFSFLKIFSVVYVFFLLSCSTGPKKVPPRPAAPGELETFNSAKKDISKKQYKSAHNKLKQLVSKNKPSEITNDAYVTLGDLHYNQGDYDKAYRNYISVVNSQHLSPKEAYAAFMATKSLTQQGRFDEAYSLIQRLSDYSGSTGQSQLNIVKLRYYILSQVGDKLDALKDLSYLSANDTDLQKQLAYKNKAIDIVQTQLSYKQLSDIAYDGDFGHLQGYALYRLANEDFQNKDFSSARSKFYRVIELLPDTETADKSQQYVQQIEARRKVAPKTIGVVLPLSSHHKDVAYRTLQGLQLGLGIFGDSISDFRLAVIDSETNPDQARRAVERLVLEDNVIAIVGSLLSKTAVAVASKAEELGVPNITLSQKSGLTDIGPYVFRSALTSQIQVRELVKTAMEVKGHKKFAIMYPNDRYGIEFTNLFWDEVLARGGEIVGVQKYEPGSTNFSDPIQRLVGTFYIDDRIDEYKKLLERWYEKQPYINSRISPPEDLLRPVVDFDALFIPDSIKAVGQIAPSLAYYEVSNVTLLGTNLWNTPGLITRGQKYVENSIFVDGLLQSDPSFKNSYFYRHYVKTFQAQPTIFEAQAYDVGLLLRQLILEGHTSRLGLKEALASTGKFQGALGTLHITKDREISRDLVRLGVHKGKIISLKDIPEAASSTQE